MSFINFCMIIKDVCLLVFLVLIIVTHVYPFNYIFENIVNKSCKGFKYLIFCISIIGFLDLMTIIF